MRTCSMNAPATQRALVLISSRYSSMLTFFPRTLSHKVSTAPCTMRPGDPRTAQTTASTAVLTVIQCRNPTATPRARKWFCDFRWRFVSCLLKAGGGRCK